MTTITDIFREFGPEYLRRYQDQIPEPHRQVIDAIINCRSGAYGVSVYRCESCGECHTVNRSCGNRHCPSCQHHKQQQWLQKQIQRQLPTHYFLGTFTLPESLRPFVRSHQRISYEAMFQASSGALKALARDPRFLGADLPGFSGILHTWGRKLQSYHPHIHYLLLGGGLSPDRAQWRPSRPDFYLPVQALSKIYRAKFRDAMKEAQLLDAIDPRVGDLDWVVHCQAVGDGKTALRYLAPYVFKVAISDKRILRVQDRRVFFQYRVHRSRRYRTTSLEVFDFLRSFLQHTLPPGFQKVRHYGLHSASANVDLNQLRQQIAEKQKPASIPCAEPVAPPTRLLPRCPDCGGDLRLIYSILPTKTSFIYIARAPP